MRIFDTHAHYDAEAFDADREEVIASLPEQGVAFAVNVGASMEGAAAGIDFAQRYAHMYAACGIHPDETASLSEEGMAQLEALCRHEKCVAVGEIGLDYYWMAAPKEVQQYWFIRQLELAVKLDLPVNIHSRDAAQDTFDIIKKHHAGTTGGIIHCFSGSEEMAREYVKMGYHIGIGGVVTFKNGKTLKKVAASVPAETIVTETDCPYLTPVPFRGKRNDSTYLKYVIEEIASLRETDAERMSEILFANACRIYRIPDPAGQR